MLTAKLLHLINFHTFRCHLEQTLVLILIFGISPQTRCQNDDIKITRRKKKYILSIRISIVDPDQIPFEDQIAQWVKPWSARVAVWVPILWWQNSSAVNRVSLHTTFHNQISHCPDMTEILLKITSKDIGLSI